MFLAIFLFIASTSYVFLRGWQVLPPERILKILYTGVYLFAWYSVFRGILLSDRFMTKPGIILELIGGYWIIFFFYFLLAALIGDLFRIMHYFLGIFPKWITTHFSQVRRIYFTSVCLFLITISITGYIRFTNPRVVKLNLPVNKENCEFGKLCIVAASDIHLGSMIHKNRLAKWIDMINNQQPDIIFLVGDIFDRSFNFDDSQGMDKELSRLYSADGVFAVLGNHEYYNDINRPIEYLKRSGITLLRDSVITIDNRFVVIGRDDITNSGRKLVDSLASGIDPTLPVILLDHQPSNLTEAINNNIDIQISGHLHNGQVFPYNLYLSKLWQLSYGYRKIGESHFYVSSGLGLRIAPLRFGTQSEIVRIELHSKNN